MSKYILKRIATIPLILLGVTFLVFSLFQLAPGDATTALLGPMATEAAKESMRHSLGLDKPFIMQYVAWLTSMFKGDFGTSWVLKAPVVDIIMPKFFNTIILTLFSLIFACFVGVTAGISAAVREGSCFDKVLGVITMIFGSTPTFWFSLILIWFFSLSLRWFPTIGIGPLNSGSDIGEFLRHLVLPMVSAGIATAAIVSRVVRSSMLEVMNQPYILVARSRGTPRYKLIFVHALRNALPPIVTVCGTEAGYMMGGVIFVEVVFAWPGIGQQLYNSIMGRDLPVVQLAVLLIALSFVLINFIADVLNTFIDPRLKTK